MSDSAPAIVLAASGTSMPTARKVFDHIDQLARERYPQHEIRWAFTSNAIIRKLRSEGIAAQCPEEVAADLRDAGFRRVAIQSLHIVPGRGFEKLKEACIPRMRVAIGKPLLASDQDMQKVIAATAECEPALRDPQIPVVLAAHGNSRRPEFNRELIQLDALLRAAFPATQVATLKGQPGSDGLAEASRLARKMGRVHFIPFMLVPGDHLMNDVMGDEPGSWKQIVGAASTTCSQSLGYRDQVLQLFFVHLDDCLNELK